MSLQYHLNKKLTIECLTSLPASWYYVESFGLHVFDVCTGKEESMKVKVFHLRGNEIRGEELENRLKEWLKDQPDIKIRDVQQSVQLARSLDIPVGFLIYTILFE